MVRKKNLKNTAKCTRVYINHDQTTTHKVTEDVQCLVAWNIHVVCLKILLIFWETSRVIHGARGLGVLTALSNNNNGGR